MARLLGSAAERYADRRLPNVEPLRAVNAELVFEPQTLDAAIIVLAYHDFYMAPEGVSRDVDPCDSVESAVL